MVDDDVWASVVDTDELSDVPSCVCTVALRRVDIEAYAEASATGVLRRTPLSQK